MSFDSDFEDVGMKATAEIIEEVNILGPLEVKGGKLGARAQGPRHQIGVRLGPVGIEWEFGRRHGWKVVKMKL